MSDLLAVIAAEAREILRTAARSWPPAWAPRSCGTLTTPRCLASCASAPCGSVKRPSRAHLSRLRSGSCRSAASEIW